jgi:hypothetical protein
VTVERPEQGVWFAEGGVGNLVAFPSSGESEPIANPVISSKRHTDGPHPAFAYVSRSPLSRRGRFRSTSSPAMGHLLPVAWVSLSCDPGPF